MQFMVPPGWPRVFLDQQGVSAGTCSMHGDLSWLTQILGQHAGWPNGTISQQILLCARWCWSSSTRWLSGIISQPCSWSTNFLSQLRFASTQSATCNTTNWIIQSLSQPCSWPIRLLSQRCKVWMCEQFCWPSSFSWLAEQNSRPQIYTVISWNFLEFFQRQSFF